MEMTDPRQPEARPPKNTGNTHEESHRPRAGRSLATAVILAGSATQVSAAEPAQNDPATSPAAYVDYLRHSHEKGAAETLNAFQELKPSEQSRFIAYLRDPALFTAFLEQTADRNAGVTAFSENARRSTSLRDGDVTFESERTVSGLAASRPLRRGNHTATHTNKLKLFGINVVQFKLWVNFYSNGRDITRVNDADGSKRNLSGVIRISKGIPKKSLSDWQWCPVGGSCSRGHNANASIVWEGEIGVAGVGEVQIDKRQTMKTTVHGKTTGSLKNA
ncbi:hypothetical protein [Streptomyces vastus]|uniref:Uncharacterized protein n=1 Tax=Streptomyces vastus TaxID=285451 RepID=A0ABP6DZ19_9ACTN